MDGVASALMVILLELLVEGALALHQTRLHCPLLSAIFGLDLKRVLLGEDGASLGRATAIL